MIDPIELHALADGELSPERAREVERWLANSPEASAEYRSIVVLKTALKKHTPGVDCGQQWKACAGRLKELERTRKVERLVSGRFAWGLAGSLAAAILVAGAVGRGRDTASVHSADLVSMVANLTPSRAPAAKNDPRFSRELEDLLSQARVSLDPRRLEVRSWATGDLDGRPVTRFGLRDASGDLALLVVPGELRVDGVGEVGGGRSPWMGHIEGLNCVAWSVGGNTLVLVGDREYEDLAQTASRIGIR